MYLGDEFAINHPWWIQGDICRLMALISLTSLVVSTVQETLIAVERCYSIVFIGKRGWLGKRGNLILSGSVWMVGIGTSATLTMDPARHLPNRLCLAFNFFEEAEGAGWVQNTTLLVTINLLCSVVLIFSALKIHKKVLSSALEIEKMTERRMKSNTAYIKKLLVILLVFLVSKVGILLLVSLPAFGFSISAMHQIWIFAPFIGISAALNPFVYAQTKSRPKA
jgi:hypothetical protein